METDTSTGISHFVNDFDDDYTAFYFADHFEVGTDGEPENQRQVAIVVRCQDLSDYDDIDRNTDVDVLVVPCAVNDKTWTNISEFQGIEDDYRNRREAVVEMCVSYGAYAHVTRFASGVRFGDVPTLAEIAATDDRDAIEAWIAEHGATVASATAGLIGFALDGPQNRVGETGWDWLMPHMYDDYTSETLWETRFPTGGAS